MTSRVAASLATSDGGSSAIVASSSLSSTEQRCIDLAVLRHHEESVFSLDFGPAPDHLHLLASGACIIFQWNHRMPCSPARFPLPRN